MKLKNKVNVLGIVIFLMSSILFLNSCYKFKGDQTVPSYLRIDSIGLSTYYPVEGAATHNITDAWVYVNDQMIGVFELPAEFPILANGVQKLRIDGGIRINGISSTRAPYPFYQPIVYNSFAFFEDSIMVLPPTIKTEYYDELTFAWDEDFEGAGLTMEEASSSDTVIKRTQEGLDPVKNLNYAGVVNLTEEKPYWNSLTINTFPMPQQGAPVLLEIDYKTDNFFTVGLFIFEQGTYIKVPLVIVTHSDTWNKIYINLGPNLSLHPFASNYKVLIESGLESDNSEAAIFIDNLKLIYRPI